MEYFDRFPIYRQWPLKSRDLYLHHIPLIDYDTPVVHFGSCFGENIQLLLDMYHFNLIEHQAGYKYSCHSIAREIQNAYDNHITTEDRILRGSQGYTDLNHHRIFDKDPDVCLLKVNCIERNVRESLQQAKVVILTPSLNEVWFNHQTNEFILHPYPGVLRDDGELEIKFLSTTDNIAQLENTRKLLLAFNPEMQIIISVCPISLRLTYQDVDAVQANNTSKFTIYAAVQDFTRRHDNVHYFPGFDIVTSELAGRRHYTEDNRHLTQPAIRHYLRRFCAMFCSKRSHRIVSVLEDLEVCRPQARPDCVAALEAAGYDPDMLCIKMANVQLLAGETKEAFDILCRVSLLQQSPAICLNLGLLLLELGLPTKAADFLRRTASLLDDIPSLAFAMADRKQRLRLGDNYMMTCGNISDFRSQNLIKMRELATNLLDGRPVPIQFGPRKLLFLDSLQHSLFPIGMSQSEPTASPVHEKKG